MPDAIFDVARLADIYDALDDDRSDLEAYVAIVDELGAQTVLDIGCGTGTFACRLAERGTAVTGLDPASASLNVARRKPNADAVRWLEGEASSLPVLAVDVATMTGNVAQVFLTDGDWMSVLTAARRAIRPGGFLVFEVRDPARRAWEGWTPAASLREVDVAGVGPIRTWTDVTELAPPLVSFRHTFEFANDQTVLTSESTVRFRERFEIGHSLDQAGFVVRDVRDAPDRPGLEFVFIAERGEDR